MSPDAPTPDVQATAPVSLLAGRYQLLDKLGQGGMGTVFHARDSQLDRAVAIKLLPAGSVHDPSAVARFRREAKALARLSHPGIVQAFDHGADGDQHFLVMEFVPGRSLAAVLHEPARVGPARAADFAYQAALALHHAHKSGLVHRDVKPSNLLLSADGRVRLLDLGLARFLQDQIGDANLTREGSGMGTPDYCPPEQFHDAHHADPRSDVYSLGCTLYHLIAGRVPFPGSSFSEKVQAHETQEPTPLEELCPEVPAGLALTVRRMMAKRPADRFQSMAEVAEALMPHVAGSSASFPEIRNSATWDGSRLATLPAFRRRGRLVALSAAAVLLVASGVAVVGLAAGWFRPAERRVALGIDTSPAETGRAKPAEEPPKKEEEKPKPAHDPNVLTVSREEKDGGKYRTITAALEAVKPGQTIRILDEAVYQERLSIKRASMHTGITLEAPGGATLETVTPGSFLIEIAGVQGVTLRGLRLRASNTERCSLVVGRGDYSGLRLEGLDLSFEGNGNGNNGVELIGTSPGPAPVLVQGCRFRGLTIGVSVGTMADQMSAHIAVRNGTFTDCAIGVLVSGKVGAIQVVGNRFWGAGLTALQLQLLSPDSKGILVANNTCYEGDAAFRLWDGAANGKDVQVRNNLVLGCQGMDMYHIDAVDPIKARGPGNGAAVARAYRFGHNWREGKAPASDARRWVPADPKQGDVLKDKIGGVNRDPKSPDFLRPDKDSPLATDGAGKEDPSLPCYVGALPPEGTEPWDWDRTWRMPKEAQLLTVSKDAKDGGKWRTIDEALETAKPWDTIRVLDAATYGETIVLDQKEKQEGLALEAPRGATILMTGGAPRALVIRDVPRLRVSGFRIRQVEEQKVDAIRFLVQVKGHCPGLKLEGLELRPSVMAVAASLEGVSGLPGEPVCLIRCRVDGVKESTDGIILAGSMDPAAATSRDVIIRDNRITGVLRGIHLQGALADVQVAGNLIFGCAQEALGVTDLTPKAARLLLANNSLTTSSFGVRGWVDESYTLTSGQVEFRNNLVLANDLGDMTVVAGETGQSTSSVEKCRAAAADWRFGGNWRDLGGTAHLVPLAPGDSRLDDTIPLPRNPGSADFLRPPAKSPLATGGAGKDDPSLPAYVGAVPPQGTPAWDWDRAWRARVTRTDKK